MAEIVARAFLLICFVFEIVSQTKFTGAGSQGFLQANNEVRYIVDGVSFSVHQEFSDTPIVNVNDLDDEFGYEVDNYLRFDPPSLDFGHRHVGIPHHEKVILYNIHRNQTIHLSSISGETVHFHSSFFEAKIVPPGENTSFSVVFLGREEGAIKSNLFIHTSEGVFKYKVQGVSVENPYRVRPLLGIELPLNASFSPTLFIHNPYTETLHIMEVYSSGGDFRLELPSGQRQGPRQLWDIPAFETRPIIRLHINSTKTEKNYTGYIRIKFNHTEEILIVPLHIKVISNPGLYSPITVLDFGVGGNHDQPKQLNLMLLNSGKKSIRIESIVTSPPSDAVKIDFTPTKVPADLQTPMRVATITFDYHSAFNTEHWKGKIVVKGKHNQNKFVLPYVARLINGNLDYDPTLTHYSPAFQGDITSRNFTAVNKYDIPLAVLNITVSEDMKDIFKVVNFQPVIMNPGDKLSLFQLKSISKLSTVKLKSQLFIHTNVSVVKVPVVCYDGLIKWRVSSGPDEKILDFGIVATQSRKELYVSLENTNPITLEILGWGTMMANTFVEFVGIVEGNGTQVFTQYEFYSVTNSMMLPTNHFALFRLLLVSPEEECVIIGEFHFQTQYETIRLSGTAQVALGSFSMFKESLIIGNCYPGKLCKQTLRVNSVFDYTMNVTKVEIVPPDSRVSATVVDNPIIPPYSITAIAEIWFDYRTFSPEENYLGIPENITSNEQWFELLTLPSNTLNTDLVNLFEKYHRYVELSEQQLNNVTFRLDTTLIRSHMFRMTVRLIWPYLSVGNVTAIKFPTTQVGNMSQQDLLIRNPSEIQPMFVQLVLDCDYPNGHSILDNLPPSLPAFNWKSGESVPGTFSFEDLKEETKLLADRLNAPIHLKTVAFIMQPREFRTVKMFFTPKKAGKNNALLFLRNNLTIIDILQLSGYSTQAHFRFGNRKPGSNSPPLLFELTDKHLRECQRDTTQQSFSSPTIMVRRTFMARNTGDVTIYIRGFDIEGSPCEGFGFSVVNCEPFVLQANGTRRIEITFTPDFTLSYVNKTLNINTSLGISVNYTLLSTIQPHLLQLCSGVLARPVWEPYLYYFSVVLMGIMFVAIIAWAHLDCNRILYTVALASDHNRPLKLLDLNKVATRSSNFNSSNAKQQQTNNNVHDLHITPVKGHAQDKTQHHSINTPVPKNNSWTSLKTSQIPLDTGIKEQISPKYDDNTESMFQRSSSPVLTYRSKKKTSKKINIAETSDTVPKISLLKKSWNSVFSVSKTNNLSAHSGRAKSAEPDNKTSSQSRMAEMNNKKNIEVPESKKSSQMYKKNKPCIVETVPVSEEDTCSTTTESSNNEDLEKDRDSSRSNFKDCMYKTTPKKVKGKVIDYKDNYEGDYDDDECERDVVKRKDSRWKANNKIVPKPTHHEKPVNTNLNNCKTPPSLELPYNFKTVKNFKREHKENNVLKKRSAETSSSTTNEYESSNHNATATATPRTISPWTENHVSFSEVVARPESLYSSVSAPRKQTQQTFKEPVCRKFSETSDSSSSSACSSSTTSSNENKSHDTNLKLNNNDTNTNIPDISFELGPIGSKKPLSSSVFGKSPPPQDNPLSIFSDTLCRPPPGFADEDETLKGLTYPPDILWDDPPPLMRQRRSNTKESKSHNNIFKDTWPESLWDPLCTPVVTTTSSITAGIDSGALSLFSHSLNDPPPPGLFTDASNASGISTGFTSDIGSAFSSNITGAAVYSTSTSEGASGWGALSNSTWTHSPWSSSSLHQSTTFAQPPAHITNSETISDVRSPGLEFGPFNSVSNIWSPHPSLLDPWNVLKKKE